MLTWFEMRRRAALLTMTVSRAAADRAALGDGQILGVLERRGGIPFGGGAAAGYSSKEPNRRLTIWTFSFKSGWRVFTRGLRDASVFRVGSMIRDARARSLIDLDLEPAVQALVERFGRDDPETVKLTGIHHNLIRSWANA
jgi:hypothetical protein